MGINHSMYPYIKPFDNIEKTQENVENVKNVENDDFDHIYILTTKNIIMYYSRDLNTLMDNARNISKTIITRSMTQFGSNYLFSSEEEKTDDNFFIRIYSKENNSINSHTKLEQLISVRKLYSFQKINKDNINNLKNKKNNLPTEAKEEFKTEEILNNTIDNPIGEEETNEDNNEEETNEDNNEEETNEDNNEGITENTSEENCKKVS
jgi:hypothetical protein